MKKISIITIIIMFSTVSLSASETKDCSEKKLINKILCKTIGNKKDSNSNFSLKPNFKNIKEKKYISDWFKKN